MKKILSSALVAMLVSAAIAAPLKFELVLNNGSGTFLPDEITAKDQTDFNFGVVLDEAGIASPVAVDDANAIATISGKYWNDHGSNGVVLTIPVDGPVLVTASGCAYSDNVVTIADADGGKTTFSTPTACWKNDHSQVAQSYYTGGPTTLTITGHKYVCYLSIESLDELPELVHVSYACDEAGVEGVAPAAADVKFNSEYTLPFNRTLYKAGYTLTGWSDGSNTYKPGEAINLVTDIALTPVFKANGNDINSRKSDVTVVWDFQRNNGAPTLAAEGKGKSFTYVAQTLVDGETQDVAMLCNVEGGKIANGNWGDWCQVNSGTVLTIPSAQDAQVTVETYSVIATTTFNGVAATGNDKKKYTYTEANDTDKCEIAIKDGDYYRTVAVVLPANWQAPTGDSYESTPVTLTWKVGNESAATVSEGMENAIVNTSLSVGTDLEVSNPTSYTMKAEGVVGPYVVYRPNTGNPGCVPTDMIEYTIKVKKGLTFVPTSVSFDAVKDGTDAAYFSWTYAMDGTESAVKAYSDSPNQIRRNNDANPKAPVTHFEQIAESDGCRTFALRFYISNVANNKKMAIGNIKVNGMVSGEVEVRDFQDFKIDFRPNPYVVNLPASGVLPAGVKVEGSWHDSQHGYNTTVLTVPCDGPVKFTFGSCQYNGNKATVKAEDGTVLASVDCSASCDNDIVWYYNDETPQTLTITTASYVPYFYAEACELLPMFEVSYYDVDGKALLGRETVQGGSPLAYAFGEADVTVDEGKKFRGWFNSTQNTAVKIAAGTIVQDNLKLYAKATDIEEASSTARYIYDLTKANFDVDDHEAIEIDGHYYNTHGWIVDQGGAIRLHVSPKAYITVGNCLYSSESTAVVTGEDGVEYDTFQVKGESDGAVHTFKYDGKEQWLSINFPAGAYVHSVKVSNVVDFVTFDEESRYYQIAPSDVSSFLIALTDANSRGNVKIYLPNGIYNLGEDVLTTVSGKNISIIGESMEGTIIYNCPPKEQEGIGTTATLLNTSDGLYMQDLTLQNGLDYYATGAAGRAVCLQDQGKNTICKNVRMLSYQDTYYSNSANRFYWEDCEIHGTVDYLCGDGDVIYNRVKLYNESRAKNTKDGSDVIAAPYTSANCKWGYVFLDCEVASGCKDFTFARSWGGESKAIFLRTKVTDNSLNASRWTTSGMNIAAYKFGEFMTTDADGNITTPASNVVNFTHSNGNRQYETVLSDEEAALYTVANIFGAWAPDQTTAQVEPSAAEFANPEADAAYLVDGVICYGQIPADAKWVRKANARGGFGPMVEMPIVGIQQVEAENNARAIYNMYGQRLATARGICVEGGRKVLR